MAVLRSKRFDLPAQAQFAALSGDFNPMHMDPLAARRTQAGAPVVHGVHALLWLLESILEGAPAIPRAGALNVRFRNVIYVDDVADAELVQITARALRARVLAGGVEALSLSIDFGEPRQPGPAPAVAGEPSEPVPQSPLDVGLDQIAGRRGRLRFVGSAAAAASAFPNAARYLGPRAVAALACCSSLVGMVVPGLYSLFRGLELTVGAGSSGADELTYAVASIDERFRLVRIAVVGGGLSGSLEAFSRFPPVRQPAMAQVAPLVARGDFVGSTALVVGGSRGLGELTAKLLAAGGARVIVTYQSGRDDAARVAAEIEQWGAECGSVQYDVRRAASAQLAALTHAPTHLYYFATPSIFRRRTAPYDRTRFQDFNVFYIDGFAELVTACQRLRPDGLSVFYPSSVAVETRPADMTEYAMSKAAGEILCQDLQKWLRGMRFVVRRLPRLPTDQTGSLVPIKTADPLPEMLAVVREMHRAPVASGERVD